ncbi:MAG: arginase family protein, partial [Sphingomonas sp.]
DLALSYPQWQGSGRSTHLPRGAAATGEVCARFAPLAAVPLSDADGDAHGVRRCHAIFDQFRAAQAILAERQPARLLTAGGDCAVDIAPIDYLHSRYPDLTVVWIDTHLDATTPATSPSGNFHGMPVSAIMGHAPAPMRALLRTPIDPARFFYCAVRIGDDGDEAFRAVHGLRTLDPAVLPTGPIHIHFDLDVLDPDEFPFLAYPEPAVWRWPKPSPRCDDLRRAVTSSDLPSPNSLRRATRTRRPAPP